MHPGQQQFPIIIQVSGTINHGNTTKVSGGSCNTAADKIELKEISNVTIIGVGGGAIFDQLGIHIRDASNIIIQNVTIRNVKKSGSPLSNGGDAIGMESNVRNIWVDHVTLEASGGEAEGFDGLFDMKDNTQYVTLSYSILRNSGRGGLVGSSESDLSNGFITYHHNLYENIDSRTPLLRGGIAHIYNNYYVSLNESGINSRAGARAKVDNNYFRNSKDVLGTFYTDELGFWQVSGNTFDNVTWSAPGTDNRPAGPNVQSTTTVSIPYSYTPRRGQLRADARRPDGRGQQGSAGVEWQLLAADHDEHHLTAADDPTTTTRPPTTTTTTSRPPTTTTTTTPPPSGPNLSIGAGSDGSSKADGTSYGNVRDGNMSTYWSPVGTTGSISIKWGSATAVSRINIRTASGSGTIGSFRVINADTGAVLASGSGAGVISFARTSLSKITFEIVSATGTPRIGEYETYAA